MFCPECGQQQVTDEVRFCSRCGFQLAGVTGLLASRGALAAAAALTAAAAETPRRKGVRQGAKLFLFGIFIIPVLFLLSEFLNVSDEIGMLGLILVLGGMLRMIYAMMFEEGPYRLRATSPSAYVPPPVPPQMGTPARGGGELPPAHSLPARDYAAPRPDTAEISYRPSVTENTTRLLDDQRDTPAR